jgi:hypothetical protein
VGGDWRRGVFPKPGDHDRLPSRRTRVTSGRKATNFFASRRYLSTEVNSQIQGGSDVPELTEAERQYLTETQSLTRNDAGREVLIGLTDLESNLLMAYRRWLAAGNTDQDPENLSIWLDLAERHALARPL